MTPTRPETLNASDRDGGATAGPSCGEEAYIAEWTAKIERAELIWLAMVYANERLRAENESLRDIVSALQTGDGGHRE